MYKTIKVKNTGLVWYFGVDEQHAKSIEWAKENNLEITDEGVVETIPKGDHDTDFYEFKNGNTKED